MCTREPCAFQRTENGTRATLSLACCQCPIGCRHAVQQPSWRYSFVPLAREFSSPRLTIRSQPIRQWTSCPRCSSRWSRERGERDRAKIRETKKFQTRKITFDHGFYELDPPGRYGGLWTLRVSFFGSGESLYSIRLGCSLLDYETSMRIFTNILILRY